MTVSAVNTAVVARESDALTPLDGGSFLAHEFVDQFRRRHPALVRAESVPALLISTLDELGRGTSHERLEERLLSSLGRTNRSYPKAA